MSESTSQALFSLAGFQVTIIGRFWVTAEVVSQESSADVMQAAFSLGALGYVAKANAGIELLATVEAVRRGRRFVSAGLAAEVGNG